MSGFLQRLARQTTIEEAGAVHSRAKLPFAAPPHRWEPEDDIPGWGLDVDFQHRIGSGQDRDDARFLSDTDATPTEPASAHAGGGGLPGDSSDGAPGPGNPTVRERRQHQGSRGRAATEPLLSAFHQMSAEAGLAFAPRGVVRIPRRLVPTSPSPSAPAASGDLGSRIGDPPITPSPPPGSPSAGQDSPHAPPAGPEQAGSVRRVGEPTDGPSFGPHGEGFPGPILPRSVSRPGIYETDRPDEPDGPEVHVHIGRIEVTATSGTSLPPRRNEADKDRPKPMSLDEYLGRRQGRPS